MSHNIRQLLHTCMNIRGFLCNYGMHIRYPLCLAPTYQFYGKFARWADLNSVAKTVSWGQC